MIMTGFIWPGWPMLPGLMLAAGFGTLASFVQLAVPGPREDAKKKGTDACR